MLKCPKCRKTAIMGVQYGYPHPEEYDGISEWQCLNCVYRQGRWTGQELLEEQCESRYGRNGVVINPMTKKKRLEKLYATEEAVQVS